MLPQIFTKQTNSKKRRGTAIVEMALVVTILLALTMGLIQWGMILNATISITNLSREGARFAAVHHSGENADETIRTYIRSNAPPGINANDLTISITPPEGPTRQSRQAIVVTVEYDMKKKLFLPNGIFGVQFFDKVYRATGQMMAE